jgi:hypothetical protein
MKKELNRAERSRRSKKSLEIKKLRKQNHDHLVEVLLTNVPEELKDRFRVWCMERGYTMTGKIRLFMRDCVMGRYED